VTFLKKKKNIYRFCPFPGKRLGVKFDSLPPMDKITV
jgi:hypothetical protein